MSDIVGDNGANRRNQTLLSIIVAALVSVALLYAFAAIDFPGPHWYSIKRPIAYALTVWAAAWLFSRSGHLLPNVGKYGLLIDEYNRVSLSRLQMFLWTLVVFPAIAVATAFNLAGGVPPTKLTNDTTEPANSFANAFNLVIPPSLWLVLGISSATLVLAKVIKDTKDDAAKSEATKKVGTAMAMLSPPERQSWDDTWVYEGGLAKHREPIHAELSDLILADAGELTQPPRVDINRVQQLFLSLIVCGAYAAVLFRLFGGQKWVAGFPTFSEGAQALILISHASYLVGKATTKIEGEQTSPPGPPPPPPVGGQPANVGVAINPPIQPLGNAITNPTEPPQNVHL